MIKETIEFHMVEYESADMHEDCYADQCLAITAGTVDNECGVANA